MTRYVIAEVAMYDHLHKLIDIPDAEHIHVTIKDGEITAVPMRQAGLSFDGMLIEMEQIRFPFAQAPGQTIEPVWVDTEETPRPPLTITI